VIFHRNILSLTRGDFKLCRSTQNDVYKKWERIILELLRVQKRGEEIEGKRCGYCITERNGQCPLHPDGRKCRMQAPERNLDSFAFASR